MVELFQGTFDLTIETVALETDISERLVVIDIWLFCSVEYSSYLCRFKIFETKTTFHKLHVVIFQIKAT